MVMGFLPVCTAHLKWGTLNSCANDLQKLGTRGKSCSTHLGRPCVNIFQLNYLTYLMQEQIGFWSCEWWPGPVKNLETNNWKSALGL